MAGGRDGAGGSGGSVKCGSCDKTINDNKESSIMCNLCGEWSHLKCMKLESTHASSLKKHPCLWFVCDECRGRSNETLFRDLFSGSNTMMNEFDNIGASLKVLQKENYDNICAIKREMMENMKSLNENIVENLKAEIDKLNGNTSIGQPETQFEKVEKQLRDTNVKDKYKASYAQKLTTGLEKNQLIVKCVDDEKKAMTQRGAIAKSLLAFKVNNIVAGKSGDVIVTLSSKELVDKAKSTLDACKFENEITTQSKDKLQPKIRICDVENEDADTDLTTEQLRETLLEKNSYLKNLIKNTDDFKVIKRMKSKRYDAAYHFVIKCTPEIRSIIRTKHEDYLYSLMSRHKVTDHIQVWQCYNCQDFQHSAMRCTKTSETCAKCSGNHRTSECGSMEKKCINCIKANKGNINHCAYSMDCPSYKSQYNGILYSTDYGLQI